MTPEMELTDRSVKIQLLATKLNELHAQKKWTQLATTLSLIHAHSRVAESCVNDILRPCGTEARP